MCKVHAQYNSLASLGLFRKYSYLNCTKACPSYRNLKAGLEVTEAQRILFAYTMISTLR